MSTPTTATRKTTNSVVLNAAFVSARQHPER